MERRLQWARNHLDYEWIGAKNCRYAHIKQDSQVGWVDIDEKWFEMRTRRMLKLPEGMTRPRCPVQSRKYLFYKMVTEEVLPDIREKMIDFDLAYVQMDGARPHVRRWDDLQEAGAERRQIGGKQAPRVKFVLQPANSPDTNVNDLCFFRSLAARSSA